jgi:hypothetical protein
LYNTLSKKEGIVIKTLIAIPILIVKAPFMILGYLARNKVLLILVIIVAGIIFLSSKINNQNTPEVAIPNYQVIAPSPDLAPKVVATPSRVYYVRELSETEDTVTLLNWYDYNEKKWQKHTTPLPLDKSNIKIYNRRRE